MHPKRSGAGGSLGDIGTHAYNLADYVTGLELAELAADLTSFGAGRQLDAHLRRTGAASARSASAPGRSAGAGARSRRRTPSPH